MEEDYELITLMMSFSTADNAVRYAQGLHGESIHKIPPAIARRIQQLRDDGVYGGGL